MPPVSGMHWGGFWHRSRQGCRIGSADSKSVGGGSGRGEDADEGG